MPCLFKPDMHHTCLRIMPCLCDGCLPCCLLLFGVAFDNIAFVKIRSTLSACLLHGLVLLPCGISGKMTIPSKSLLSLLASCSIYCYDAIPTTCYIMPPILPCQSKLLFGYVTALLSPSYSVASCRWRWSLFHVGTWLLLGYHYYILFNLMHLYTW